MFRDVTATFWKNIKITDLHGGCLFDGEEICLIQQNSTLIEWNYPLTIGKLLFWSWVQMGSWPKWLDPLHLQYIINGKESILCISALYEHIPFLYYLTNDIKDNYKEEREEDLKSWIHHNGISVSK